MGMRQRIADLALREVHLLIVERPGWTLTRIAAERAITARGWRVAHSAADAEALLYCGEPGPDLDPLVDRLFTQLPRPKAKGQVEDPEAVDAALDRIIASLRTEAMGPVGTGIEPPSVAGAHQTTRTLDHGATDHATMDHGAMDHGAMGHEGMDHGGMAHAGMGHEGMDHGGMDHGGMGHEGMGHEGMDHEGMDHGGMAHAGMDHGEMSGPGGIPLAGGAQDRDGLEMDVLPVRLGPVLPAWPAGLVLSVTLAGDLISECKAGVVGVDTRNTMPPRVSRHQQAALAADRIGWLLMLAGAEKAERQLRRVRDNLLDVADIPGCAAHLRGLTNGLFRSRVLSWSLRDLGRLDQVRLNRIDERLDWSGDVLDRLHRRLSVLLAIVDELADFDPRSDLPAGQSIDRAGLDLVADTVRGLDLGTARLVVASFDIDLTGGVAAGPSAVIAGQGDSS